MKRSAGVAMGLIVAAALAAGAWQTVGWRARQAERDRGEALFRGSAALPGRLVGHEAELPVLASRCINCHESTDARAGSAGRAFASPLGRTALTQDTPRHGGPPSRYDLAHFCTLLRSGVDPASVMIPTTMPRYRATDEQCAALWAHLLTR